MAYNGSGTFLINTAGQPVVPNTVISATAFNALTADLANGLSTCITKDGQTTPTANIPMGNNKITGLAAGTAGTDAANLSQVQSSTAKLLQSVTGTDTITAAMVPALTAYAAGQMFYFVAAGDNTGAVTINIDSLGAKSVTRDGSTALVAGDITNGKVVVIVYDGTRFQLLNSNSFTNLNVSNNLTLSGGTANGVLYLNGSKVATSGTALVFDGTNLGIGTSSPVRKLHAYTSGAAGVALFESASGTTAAIGLKNTGSSSLYPQLLSINDDMAFQTNGSERLRLDSSGNLGLGVTPSAWTGSGGKNIEIGATGNAIFGSASLTTYIYNANFDSSWKYSRSDFASRYEQQAGIHRWFTAPSGTAGNTISFTQAMTLDSSGNLLVGGTSSPGTLNKQLVINSGASALGGFGIQNNTTGTSFNDGGWFYLNGSDLKITNFENAPIIFETNGNTECARITSGRELLVGTTATTAGARLDVKGVDSTGGNYCIFFENSGSALLMAVQNDGRWRSGTAAASPYNYIVGGTNRDLFVDNGGDIGYVSSVRASKTNITPDVDTDWLLQLNPVTFNFRKRDEGGNYTDEADGPIKHGLIAEEVEEVNVDLCFYDDEDKGGALRGVNYSHLITPMLKLIQKQQAAIAALEADMAALKGAK